MIFKNSLFFTLLYILTFSLNTYSANKTIKVALGEWPPYSSEDLPHGGLVPFILKQAMSTEDITTRLYFMPWQEAFTKTLQGKYSLSPGWLKTSERQRVMDFSEPMTYIDLRFVHAADKTFSWKSLDDIENLELGIVLGYSYGKNLDQRIQNGKIKTTDYLSEKEALIGLANGEIDLYAADSIVANAIINELSKEQQIRLTIDEQTIDQSPIFLISSRRLSKSLINKFNKGLDFLKQQGQYQKILENFNLITKIDKLHFYTEDNAPLNYAGTKKAQGIMVGVIHAILQNIGADTDKIDIEILPWARAYRSLENNKKTMLFAVTKTDERDPNFKWVGPVYRSNIILLGRKNMFSKPKALSSLKNNSVCSVKEDVSEKLWKDQAPDSAQLFLVTHPKQCAKMLALGRVDLWATGEDTARWHLIKNGFNPDDFIEMHQLKESYRYIAFSKDVDEDILSSFQETLNYLKLSGELNKIIEKEIETADNFARQHSKK